MISDFEGEQAATKTAFGARLDGLDRRHDGRQVEGRDHRRRPAAPTARRMRSKITGTIDAAASQRWAGVMFSPGAER